VLESWRKAGLGERVELVELPTSAWDDPPPRQLFQAVRSTLLLGVLLWSRRRPDLVHLHASIGGSLYRKLVLAWLCRLARVPYLAHMHSGALRAWLRGSALRRAVARSLFGHAAAAVTPAEMWRDLLVELGAPRVAVIPNGITSAERERLESCRRMRERPGSGAGDARLLFFGRWAPVKGADRIAVALRELGRDDLELHIYGNGDRAWLERSFSGAPGRIEIRGWLDGEEKLVELARADAVLAPSRAEAFGMALVEVRASGAPVIATEVGGVGEALAGYEPAMLLRDGDDAALRGAIEQVLDRSWPLEVKAGPLPDALTAEASVARVSALYAELLEGR
jgi:glycosyltransferase involved in cell wall biosynthesis